MQTGKMFEGLKVVELASVLAGPSVGQFFAELGAEVIKIENIRTGGDVTRTWKGAKEEGQGVSAYFSSVNWGKKSLALDLSRNEGREIAQSLIAGADLVIVSYKPGDAEKLGVDYSTLSKNNPSLIYGQITGYGSGDDRVGYDAVIQAESGFMDMNGEQGGLPLKMPVALIDVLAAHHLKEGILLAMLKKQTTGRGELVEVSLMDAAIASLANQASNWLVANQLPGRKGSAHPNIAPYGDNYLTSDGKRVLVAIGNDRQFADLCSVLGLPDLSDSPEFTTNTLRVRNREALNGKLQQGMAQITSGSLMARCHELKIPAGIIQNLREVFEMEGIQEIMLAMDQLKGVRNMISRHDQQLPPLHGLLPPPGFGEHSKDILIQHLHYRLEQVEALRQQQVIK